MKNLFFTYSENLCILQFFSAYVTSRKLKHIHVYCELAQRALSIDVQFNLIRFLLEFCIVRILCIQEFHSRVNIFFAFLPYLYESENFIYKFIIQIKFIFCCFSQNNMNVESLSFIWKSN